MSTIDTYGELELPEEKTEIEIVENPAISVANLYDKFKENVEKKIKGDMMRLLYFTDELPDIIYAEALKVLKNVGKLKTYEKEILDILKFKTVNENEPHTIDIMRAATWTRKIAKTKSHISSSLFLSALHNITDLETLIIDGLLKQEFPGYQLASNKTLIIGPNQRFQSLGKYCKGNIVNNGISVFGDFATNAEKGVQINNKKISRFGADSKGGININNAYVRNFTLFKKKGIAINNGIAEDCEPCLKEGIIINNNIIKHKPGTLYKELSNEQYFIINYRCPELKQKLTDKLKEIEFFKQMYRYPYEKQMKLVASFDFKKFEQEITAIANEIKENEGKIR